jgi:DNA-binding response OmpR family regulator
MMGVPLRLDHQVEAGTDAPVLDIFRAPGEQSRRGTKYRIALCLPELSLAYYLRHNLEFDGHQVDYTHDPGPIAQLLRLSRAQLLVISLAAVEGCSSNLLTRLRSEGLNLPILVLASKPVDASGYAGFRLGVDEFLLRPVTVAELHGTVERMLSRIPSETSADEVVPSESIIRFGRITVLPQAHAVKRDGMAIRLGQKEFGLLMALIRRSGRIMTRQELLHDVWGYQETVLTRTVDTHITNLRGKLEDKPHEPRHILTVRNVGYRFEP